MCLCAVLHLQVLWGKKWAVAFTSGGLRPAGSLKKEAMLVCGRGLGMGWGR